MRIPKVIKELDVLRGAAVLMVMMRHLGEYLNTSLIKNLFGWGWVGVDLFFVLSGFLITGVLVNSRDDPHYFRNFYARRILRIWPLYFALLAVMLVVLPAMAPNLAAESQVAAAWPYPLFIQNLIDTGNIHGPLGPTWSLAIEEQFYLVWPFLVLFLTNRQIRNLSIGLLVGSPILRFAIVAIWHWQNSTIYGVTITHLDGLAIGSALAILAREKDEATLRRLAWIGLPISVVLIAIDSLALSFAALALCFGCFVCLGLTGGVIPRISFLSYTGKISYGLYLLHLISFDLFRMPRIRGYFPANPVANDIIYGVVAIAFSYALASLSWYIYELPLNRLKRHFEPVTSIQSVVTS